MKRLAEALGGVTDNYIAPFLWLHNEDDALIIKELEKIHESHIRSVCLESRTHEEFCREDWWSDVRLIMDFCRAHDMTVWILDDKHCPSGSANGYFAAHPELCHRDITERHVDIAGPIREGALYSDVILKAGERLLSIYACKHIPDSDVLSNEIYDLTENIKDGYVYFDLPEGMWCIVYLIESTQGIGGNWLAYSDKLNPASTQAYIREVHEKHWEHLSEYFGNTFQGFFSDESFFGNNTKNQGYVPTSAKTFMYYPWHECVREHFQTVYGADGFRNILSLWFDFEELPYAEHSDAKHRVEYMNFITDAYERNYSGLIASWCHDHGVRYIGHVVEDNNISYDTVFGAGHYFKALRPQDMAGVDVVLNQIVPGLVGCNQTAIGSTKTHNSNFFNCVLAKLGSSLAHITPHMRGCAMCEIFGAYGWVEGTRTMKYLADHMLVRGINYFVPHAFSPKPNDKDCPPNFHASGENPQFKYFHRIMDYLNRTCHVLDGITHINSCALLYDAESFWSGEPFDRLEDIARVLADGQIDYDIIPPDVLNQIDANGNLNGEHYGLILVGKTAYLRGEVREALKRIPAKVVVVSDEPDVDFEYIPVERMCAYIRQADLGDIQCETEEKHLRFLHGTRGRTHLVMFVNEDIHHRLDTVVRVKGFAGGSYVIYDPFENTACRDEGETIRICLEPYQSCVVLWSDENNMELPRRKNPTICSRRTISPVFEIRLDETNQGMYMFYRRTDELRSITGSDGHPRFSGRMRYTTKLCIDGTMGAILDLGEVGETAEVYVNGQCVGVRLFPPYRFDVSDFVTKTENGENDVEIYISNTLGTRVHDLFSAYSLIPPSGLLGPITIEQYNRFTQKP